MKPFILRALLFSAERVRMICLALTLVLMVKTFGAAALAGFSPQTNQPAAIAQPS